MQNWLVSTYEKLSLDTSQLQDISSFSNPYTTFSAITDALIANSSTNKTIIEEIINTPSIRIHFPPTQRLQIARLFPEDKETAAKLLIDTTSYYKSYDRGTYRLIYHCPDYYFLLTFYQFPKNFPCLKDILEEKGIDTSQLKYYEANDAYNRLIEFYKNRLVASKINNIKLN